MKRVIIKELHQGSTSNSSQLALSYGKHLHLLKPSDKIDQGAFSSFKIEKSHAFENQIRFDVDQSRDALVVIDDTSKALKAYALSDFTKGAAGHEEYKLKAQT
jgi:hypothetical protein